MPSQQLQSAGLVLTRRPPQDRFQHFSVLSAEHGLLLCLRRLAVKSAPSHPALDLFDEANFFLESGNQGRTWFIRELRLIRRHAAIGRDYDTLRFASAFAGILARNPGPEESRTRTYDLALRTFSAFDASERSDLVFFKALYCFARDEGYPVREDWWRGLAAAERAGAAAMLNQPLAGQTVDANAVARLTRRLEDYLRTHTEILLE